MTTTFAEQLSKIKEQAFVLENLDERAVELGVILPLLKQLGWDTEDLTQIYPQKPVPGGGKVDYDLQVADASRVFIEVKRWNHTLTDEDEGQLRDYCLTRKPSLAALTNGKQWRLYLPPLQNRRSGEIRPFLVFNITDEPKEVEKNFRRFLARENMLTVSAVKKTVGDARVLFKKNIDNVAVMEGLSEAWNELATDESALAGILTTLADSYGVQPSVEQVQEFIKATGTLVNPVKPSKPQPPVQNHVKPSSFTLQVNGEATVVKQAKHWNELLLGVCLLMHERHNAIFAEKVLEIPESFSNSIDTFGWKGQVGDTGIYFRKGGSGYVKEICPEIVSKFGYPQESLTIQEK